MRSAVIFLLSIACVPSILAAEVPDFAAGVRSSEPLSAAEQQQRFQLPEGFKISLFSEEPEIAKPMNMAFDSRGRLWVTSSLEYPYAAPADRKAKDTLRVLEDTNGDGRADKVTTFADNLNIPIGVYPFNAGASALVWSIPNILRLDDTDGDGIADQREILFGPIGEAVDTHGMQNGFTRAFDGWVYVCHGFRNESTVVAKDGSTVKLQSGNTYRFRIDGSQIEQYTWGQVNPFGMCLDPLGNHYTADCHSSPIYQLIRGGYYPSFGKPHDGLGFAPLLMQHAHGSTALCGVTYYTADSNWPREFRDTLFVGNVMTSRVHRDQVEFHGASPRAIEQPEFLTSSDPWFRPVDLQMGPDGALYIADFYNRIIGHYEVPLTHPGRDRYRGRIWRVTYEGGEPFRKFESLAASSMQEMVDRLGDPNLPARLMAMHELCDRYGADAAAPVRRILENSGSPEQRVAAMWVLERLGKLDSADLAAAIASAASRDERVHALRIAAEIDDFPLTVDTAAVTALSDSDPFVVRQAGELLGRHPSVRNIPILVAALQETSEEDDHSRYVQRRALRSQFLQSGSFAAYEASRSSNNEADAIVAMIAGSIQTSDAADFLVGYLDSAKDLSPSAAAPHFQHAARFVSDKRIVALIQQVRSRFASDYSTQAELYASIDSGLSQRGLGNLQELRAWAEELSSKLLASESEDGWTVVSFGKGGVPWILQDRMPSSANQAVPVLSSLPAGGESFTSVLRSKRFEIPPSLTVRLCGHDGFPDNPAKGLNYVVLRDAGNAAEIARVPAPRTDEIVDRVLDLGAYAGRQGYLEVVDGDTGAAFAWLGLAGVSPAVVTLPAANLRDNDARLQQGISLVQRWQLTSAIPAVAKIAGDRIRSVELRAAALLALRGDIAVSLSEQVLAESAVQPLLTAAAIKAFVRHGSKEIEEKQRAVIASAIASLPARLQRDAVTVVAELRGELLLSMVESGAVGAAVLVDAGVRNALKSAAPNNWQQRLTTLTKNVPSDLERLQKLAAERLQQYDAEGRAQTSVKRGSEIFATQCVICHQTGGNGNLVGPQLDGIGKRGAERLLEDIINPNRNVDHAFQLSYITLKNGEMKAGLFRREDGPSLVFADASGKEFSVASSEVANREDTGLSLMPPIYGEALTTVQMFDLMEFLSSK
ncbi:MAG: putative heme-binding domain-containing protein [Verrucomicrobiales bacterium]|jgi:putative heme-binding domain-containing protein